MNKFVVFPLVVGLVALVGVLLLFVGRFDFDGSGRAFSVDVLSPSSDVDVSDELVFGKSHVDASDELVVAKEEVVKDVVVKNDVVKNDVVKNDVVKEDVVKNDVVKDVVDSLDSDDGVVDDGFGFDDVDVGDAVRGLSFPVVTRYVPGVGELRNGKLSFRHSDRLSSVRLKTAANTAQVTGEFLSLPFGQELVSINSRLSFATEKELDESGLYFFGARYYDPNIGRFTGVDPVRSNHAYSYVGNNPMNSVDPTGMAGINLLDPAASFGRMPTSTLRAQSQEFQESYGSAAAAGNALYVGVSLAVMGGYALGASVYAAGGVLPYVATNSETLTEITEEIVLAASGSDAPTITGAGLRLASGVARSVGSAADFNRLAQVYESAGVLSEAGDRFFFRTMMLTEEQAERFLREGFNAIGVERFGSVEAAIEATLKAATDEYGMEATRKYLLDIHSGGLATRHGTSPFIDFTTHVGELATYRHDMTNVYLYNRLATQQGMQHYTIVARLDPSRVLEHDFGHVVTGSIRPEEIVSIYRTE
ncbi:MAG: RHS repeat-associated core domain-containing protein [Candidatus Woesearchaeota archaeon]|nr:MAG: RHS repeat-associated core domain-containing protein [Candidatus Woesearchaeota archaeon]